MTLACENIIDVIISLREEKGMTQRDLATSTNLAQSAIARLESKNATPRLDTVLRVLAPLGYTLAIVSTDTE